MAESSFFDNQSDEQPAADIPKLEKEPTDEFTTEDGRLAAILSYIPVVCLIPLFKMQHDEDARFHARQGLILFLIELLAALLTVEKIANFVFTAILIVALALAIVGVVYALQGRNYRLPIIGDLADKSKL